MSATRSYPHGVPCWIETQQPDPEAARHFYSRLMHWTTESIAGRGDTDTYLVARLQELVVAGITATSDPQASWNTYISVDDTDAAAQRVTDNGGTLRTGPSELGDLGRMAQCEDPEGAVFSLWQAREAPGTEIVRIPGAWDTSDLHTDDPERATTFYTTVFGWEVGTVDVGADEWAKMLRVPGYGAHRALQIDPHVRDHDGRPATDADDAIGWLAPIEPEDSGPSWHVTFTVGNRDDAATAAQRLGAEILSEVDSRWSRAAIVRDPQGALFSLSQARSGR